MSGLVIRGGVYIYRRAVPPRLRSIIGKREWKISLGTGDLAVAQRRLPVIVSSVERGIREAEAGVKSPAVAAYRVVQEWKQERAKRPAEIYTDKDGEPAGDEDDAMDLHLTMLLEEDERGERRLDPVQRAAYMALLKRHEEGEDEDNPPLSILFERYYAERKLPAKTKLEWEGVCRRFCETIGGDLPARSVMQAHVRQFKTSLLTSTTPSRATRTALLGGATGEACR